jgi:hypothetical protein
VTVAQRSAENEGAASSHDLEERLRDIPWRFVATEPRQQIPDFSEQPGELHVRQPDIAQRLEDLPATR